MTTSSNPAELFTWFQSIVTRVPRALADAVDETVDLGAQQMREKTDRIRTGLMYDSIDYRMVSEAADHVIGEFGFLDEQKLYFALQTVTGFEHAGGKFIEPTFALRDAYEYAKLYIQKKVSDEIEKL